jgi:hypothetical protein
MKRIIQIILKDLIAVMVFVVLSLIFFSPVFEGKVLFQSDMTHVKGASHELEVYKEQTGEIAMWTNSMFGGMPAYLVYGGKTYNVFHSLQSVVRLFLPYFTSGILFVYLIGFYFLLRVLRTSALLSFVGAFAFGFGSYNLIIIAAGHITKAYAIGYMAPILAGILLTFQGKYITGSLITLFATGIQISINHFQITYYTFLIAGLFILFKLFEALREKKISHFFIATGLSFLAILFSIIPNITSLWTIYEYGQYSTRGKSELSDEAGQKSKALTKDYILNDYSFGISEPLTLLIPNFKGGPSVSSLDEDSEMFKALVKNGYPRREALQIVDRMPTYFGPQYSTAGPVYAGAIIIFLFVFSLFLIKGPIKWWIITSICFSIGLAWGKHFPLLSNFFIDYFPAYGKFRTVSMILVVASLLIPFISVLGLKTVLEAQTSKKELLKALQYSFLITGGFVLIIALFGPGAFNFSADSDQGFPDVYQKAIQLDRAGLLRSDAFRSLGFIIMTAFGTWLFIKQKIKTNHYIAGIGFLILLDLWLVDKRYINDSNYLPKRTQEKQFSPTQADLQILRDSSYYRVLNLSVNTFNDATTSYFHKSIGGYHGAKMKRYQDLIERQISKNNMDILNMLNTKYFIVQGKERGTQVVNLNENALGNAWFIDSLYWVNSPDEEIGKLADFNPGTDVIINKKFMDIPGIGNIKASSPGDTIFLTSYKPDELVYRSNSKNDLFAVFSEIYYPKGWEVYIDNNPVKHAQVNYVLRGMVVPAGSHEIIFRFHPRSYYLGHKISFASSVFVILLLLGGLILNNRKSIGSEPVS